MALSKRPTGRNWQTPIELVPMTRGQYAKAMVHLIRRNLDDHATSDDELFAEPLAPHVVAAGKEALDVLGPIPGC